MAIIDDIKRSYRTSGMLVRIIYINVAVFLVVNVLALVIMLCNGDANAPLRYLELPAQWQEALHRPWTVVTYMFTHYDLWHILFNMLWLNWLGRVFLEYFTQRQLTALYLLGGLGGAALFLLAFNLLPALKHANGSALLGASASIMAIVVAIAIYAPNYSMGLLFLGQVPLKWIAIATVALDVLIAKDNVGGFMAHLGGIAVGVAFALAMRRGKDITRWLNRLIDGIVNVCNRLMPSKSASTATTSRCQQGNDSAQGTPTDAEIDKILDKIKRSGYAALTDDERDTLFRASRQQ